MSRFSHATRSPVTTQKLLINRSNQTALGLAALSLFPLKFPCCSSLSIRPVFLQICCGERVLTASSRNWTTISDSGSRQSCRRIR
ncbi:hypothetical protein CEXT_414131 [Caerostris extrusa]|uniref:Uncharacterized protein n=1 Tax=Caerostris extrusa TaxID=172846 RepID=A0AAV4XW94_CAEEX|nr:hypothetical protein CEXT_414131 [Caerostris extrusa]